MMATKSEVVIDADILADLMSMAESFSEKDLKQLEEYLEGTYGRMDY